MGYNAMLPPVSAEAEPGTIMLRDELGGFRGTFQDWNPDAPALAIGAVEVELGITGAVEVLTPAAASEIHGFTYIGTARFRSMLWVLNYSAFGVTLKHGSLSASAPTRIYAPSGSDHVISPMSQAFLLYWDFGWRLFA